MLLVAFIAAVIVVQGTAIQSVWAGEGSEAELKNSVAVTIGKKLSPMMKKRRSQTSREQTIHLLNEKYDFSQDELGRYLDNGKIIANWTSYVCMRIYRVNRWQRL